MDGLKVLKPKIPGVPLVAGEVLEHLKSKGIKVKHDTVMCQADGSVLVDTEDSLTGVWSAFKPSESVAVVNGSGIPVKTSGELERLTAMIEACEDFDALKAFIRDEVVPPLSAQAVR